MDTKTITSCNLRIYDAFASLKCVAQDLRDMDNDLSRRAICDVMDELALTQDIYKYILKYPRRS